MRLPTPRLAARFDAAWFDDDTDYAAGVLTTNRIAGHIVNHYGNLEAAMNPGQQRHVDEEVGYSFGLLAQLSQLGNPAQRRALGLPERAQVDGTYMGASRTGQRHRTNLEVETSDTQIGNAQAAHLRAVQEAYDRISRDPRLTPAQRRAALGDLLRSGSVFVRVAGRRPPAAGPGAVRVEGLTRQGYRVDPGTGRIVAMLRTLRVRPTTTIDELLRRRMLEYRRFDDDFDPYHAIDVFDEVDDVALH